MSTKRVGRPRVFEEHICTLHIRESVFNKFTICAQHLCRKYDRKVTQNEVLDYLITS